MTKYVIADFRIKKIIREYIESLGYEIIEIGYNLNLYDEIASHVDISCTKIGNEIIVSPDKYEDLCRKIDVTVGKSEPMGVYPSDIPYNVCIMGKKAIHNFNYIDEVVKDKIDKLGYGKIDVKQGYSNCSIAVIDDNSCITSDMGIAKILMDKGIDVLYVYEPDIKLLKRTNPKETNQNRMYFEYSDMQGFIGGAMGVIDDEVIIFGDINKFLNSEKIIKFIESKGKKIKSFDSEDIIDYGGIITITRV